MKLSELDGGAPARNDESQTWTLPCPRSSLADPPITAEEARNAPHSICVWHKGRIAHSPTPADTEGKVFLCPVGAQYWRYTKNPENAGMYRPLNYGWRP